MLFSYHLLYFCTALSLIIMLSSHYHHHKSKTFSQLTQCPFTGTLLLFDTGNSTRGLSTGVTVGGYRFQSCSDHRWGCSEGSPRSCCDHWDPYLPSAEFWTGTSPIQATGRVTSQPVMRDTGTSSVSDCRLWSQKSSKGYWLNRITGYTELLVTYSRAATGYRELLVPECCRLNGKHEKLELDLEQVFDFVGFQLAWKSVRLDPP